MDKNISPLVSICCITFNHEPYIRKCLDGFLMQKTNFDFEILIHDDASTDLSRRMYSASSSSPLWSRHSASLRPSLETITESG